MTNVLPRIRILSPTFTQPYILTHIVTYILTNRVSDTYSDMHIEMFVDIYYCSYILTRNNANIKRMYVCLRVYTTEYQQ